MSGENRSYTYANLLIGDDCRIRCNVYADHPPILGIDAGPVTLSISTMKRTADQPAVDFARALACEAQAFAAEVERFYAEHTASDTTDTPDLAA